MQLPAYCKGLLRDQLVQMDRFFTGEGEIIAYGDFAFYDEDSENFNQDKIGDLFSFINFIKVKCGYFNHGK